MSRETNKTQHNRNAGFSLIEMMVAVTVGLMIIAALTSVIVSSSAASRANDRTSELQSNGRYAMDILKRDIQSAGYYGLSGRGVNQPTGLNLPGDCFAGFANNINQRVWGSNDGVNPFAANCIPNANYAGSDILVLRYASLEAYPSAPGVAPAVDPAGVTGFANTGANTLYFRSAFESSRLFQANNLPTFNNAPQQDHIVQVHVYYISPNTVTAPADGIPSLHRMVLNSTGTMVDELVASGIENLQVQYGVVDALGNTQNLDAQNVNPGVVPATDAVTNPLDATGAAVLPNNWGNVNAVHIWLLSRNTGADRGDGYVNNTVYAMGDQNIVANAATARFRRQLFTTTIQLRN